MGENIRLSIRGILSFPQSKVPMNRFKQTSSVQVSIPSMYV